MGKGSLLHFMWQLPVPTTARARGSSREANIHREDQVSLKLLNDCSSTGLKLTECREDIVNIASDKFGTHVLCKAIALRELEVSYHRLLVVSYKLRPLAAS